MAKTRPLTKAQRERQEVERVGGEVLRLIGSERGAQEKTYEQMAEYIDLSRSQLQAWRKNSCCTASLENVVIALMRLGYRLDISPIKGGRAQ